MDVSCDIGINVLFCEKDYHNLEFDSKYFCVNHICEICVKRMIIHLKKDNYVASGFLVPVNIDVGYVKGLPAIQCYIEFMVY